MVYMHTFTHLQKTKKKKNPRSNFQTYFQVFQESKDTEYFEITK